MPDKPPLPQPPAHENKQPDGGAQENGRAQNQLKKTREELKKAHIEMDRLNRELQETKNKLEKFSGKKDNRLDEFQKCEAELKATAEKLGAASLQCREQEIVIENLKSRAQKATSLKRAGLFVDFENIRLCLQEKTARAQSATDIAEALEQKISAHNKDFFVSMRVAYLREDAKTEQNKLRDKHYEIMGKQANKRKNGGYTCNVDIAMALDVLERSSRLDVIALATGDSDFLDLIRFLQGRRKQDPLAFIVIGVKGSVNAEFMDAQGITLLELDPGIRAQDFP
ncbi:MAG: NYN domain-containing protein [Elusimicrobiota bacterium]